jgi:DNA repair protein RadD
MNKNIEKFSTVSLRPYQQTAVDQSLLKYRNGHRYSLVTLAVGLGKSWIMVFVALQFKRVVVLQPCIELVKQNHEKLANAGLDTTMIDSAHKGNWGADYIYTTPQTLCKHLDDLDEPDLLIIDEANVFWSGTMFNAIFNRWRKCRVLALTATPHYYERKTVYKHGWMCSQTTVHSISEQYGESVMTMTRDEGRKQGYCPTITFTKLRIPLIEARHLENRPAYQPLLDEHINKLNVLLKTLNNAIIFCDSKAQAEWLSEIFNIPCIFGDTPKKQREKLVEWFNNNELPFVLTVGCLVRGFDKPDLENIVMLSNYSNASEAEQIVGRLSRGNKNKTCWYIGRLNLTPPTVGKTSIVKIKRMY